MREREGERNSELHQYTTYIKCPLFDTHTHTPSLPPSLPPLSLSAKEMFEVIKSNYGSGNCCFLPINSHDLSQKSSGVGRGVANPEPWSGALRVPSAPPTEGVVSLYFVYQKFFG